MHSETSQDRTVASGLIGSVERASSLTDSGGGAKASRRDVAEGLVLGAMLLVACAMGSAQDLRTCARVALVIGNAAYADSVGCLENPVRDAEHVRGALEAVGFEVRMERNLTENAFADVLDEFGEAARSASAAVFYYAGHGAVVEGENYLIPVDLEQPERVKSNPIKVADVVASMRGRQNLVFLDACRTWPERTPPGHESRAISPLSWGLRPVAVETKDDILISYAAAPKIMPLDGEAGGNSPYAAALAEHMMTPGQRLADLLMKVRNAVKKATDGEQGPLQSASVTEKFYFVPEEPVEVPEREGDCKQFEGIKDQAEVGKVRDYIEKYMCEPRAEACVEKARELFAKLTKPPPPAPDESGRPDQDGQVSGVVTKDPPPPPPDEPGSGLGAAGSGTRPSRREPGSSWTDPQRMEFVWIPPGEFEMGSPEGEAGRGRDERQHEVRISQGFWLGKYEVKQREWEAVMGANPSHFKSCMRCPVESVSWEDVQEFISKLNKKESGKGHKYRLPTEAEWEYAARAETTGARYGELDEIAWYRHNSGGKTHPVGDKQANKWGLHDMLGNVWEWTADRYGDYPSGSVTDPKGSEKREARVIRGDGWGTGAGGVRFADRRSSAPGRRDSHIGFRLVGTE